MSRVAAHQRAPEIDGTFAEQLRSGRANFFMKRGLCSLHMLDVGRGKFSTRMKLQQFKIMTLSKTGPETA